MTLSAGEIKALVDGEHEDVFSVLGPHVAEGRGGPAVAVRALLPGAAAVRVRPRVPGLEPRDMERVHPAGLFEAVVPDQQAPFSYRLEVRGADGTLQEIEDPYRFPSTLSDFDRHLLAEGTHYAASDKLGAHLTVLEGVTGVVFAVWAPGARRVSVVGDFNRWDGRRHPMRRHPANGLWELFVPDVAEGARYKFEIRARSGEPIALKADPYAFAFEAETPRTAAVVSSLDGFRWQDEPWMTARDRASVHDRPVAIYEVHLGSWMRVPEEGDRFLTYAELGDRLGAYARDMGYTHVELLPVMEHPFYGSWGYQVIGYYAPTRRHGTPKEFMAFVEHLHRQGIGVILDWVPAHFPKDPHGLGYFDGTHLYEHADPRLGEHADWGTLIFNYGRSEVRNFLLASALFWLDEYHLDGLRVDAVASMLYLDYSRQHGQWIPNRHGGRENLDAVSFLQQLNTLTHAQAPGSITVAEESTAWPGVSRPVHLGGLGFTYKWNMGWMHDTLKFAERDPVHRRWAQNEITFSMLYAYTENYILPYSHDEVVHGKRSMLDKMPGDTWQKAATLRALYGFMFAHPGKKLLFMGDEFGQWREWNYQASLDWDLLDHDPHRGVHALVRDLHALYHVEPALFERDYDLGGFRWIDASDSENSVISFLRMGGTPHETLAVVCNWTPVPRERYRVGLPLAGVWRERLNTDLPQYGGSGVSLGDGIATEPVTYHGFPQSVAFTLPPLATIILQPSV